MVYIVYCRQVFLENREGQRGSTIPVFTLRLNVKLLPITLPLIIKHWSSNQAHRSDYVAWQHSSFQRAAFGLVCPGPVQSTIFCVHTSALCRELQISQVRALVACSMNRDQGRDLEKSKAKIGHHVVPLCDRNTLTAIGGGAYTSQYFSHCSWLNYWCIYRIIDRSKCTCLHVVLWIVKTIFTCRNC